MCLSQSDTSARFSLVSLRSPGKLLLLYAMVLSKVKGGRYTDTGLFNNMSERACFVLAKKPGSGLLIGMPIETGFSFGLLIMTRVTMRHTVVICF